MITIDNDSAPGRMFLALTVFARIEHREAQGTVVSVRSGDGMIAVGIVDRSRRQLHFYDEEEIRGKYGRKP